MRFGTLVCVVLGSAIALCACAASPHAATTGEGLTSARIRVSGLHDLVVGLTPPVDPEPSGDSTGGTYLCRIVSVTTTPTPTVVVDLITNGWQPGTTVQDRERSSWPDHWGWNKTKHRQSLSLAGATLATTSHSHDLRVVSAASFATWFKKDWFPEGNFYITFFGDRVSQLWPWTY